MVSKSFMTCGISNALDGTKDDAIYEEEIPEIIAEEDEMGKNSIQKVKKMSHKLTSPCSSKQQTNGSFRSQNKTQASTSRKR